MNENKKFDKSKKKPAAPKPFQVGERVVYAKMDKKDQFPPHFYQIDAIEADGRIRCHSTKNGSGLIASASSLMRFKKKKQQKK